MDDKTDLSLLVSQLTLWEKTLLLEGVNSWHTNEVKRLHIPAICMTDGPHGLRKVRKNASGFDIWNNEPATAFPVTSTIACSWSPELVAECAKAIAQECLQAHVQLLLAPGVNIMRSPLCGRNFEYYSEDPLLTGILGQAFVQALQGAGVGACVKHFAVNSSEEHRFYGNSVVDDRALQEIYLSAFRRIVQNAAPAGVMAAYNRVNGEYASQNSLLLQKILRQDWGYTGAVISDWGATVDRVKGAAAGLDLDMPGSVVHNRLALFHGVKSGALPEEKLDCCVKNVLRLVRRCLPAQQEPAPYDRLQHWELSRKAALQSAVLLQNDGSLPLQKSGRLAAIGELFTKMRFQGAGSSLINPDCVLTPAEAFDAHKYPLTYARGYRQFHFAPDHALEAEALLAVQDADTVLFFGGLTDFEESEGFDRKDMALPQNQRSLLEKLCATGKKIVLVLFSGSPVEIPAKSALSAILYMGLPGMQGGGAVFDLLTGAACPCGKLTQSWPLTAADSSCAFDFNKGTDACYKESIYVGYRYYDKAGLQSRLAFPFGFGLSYTRFAYSDLTCTPQPNDSYLVTALIANTGSVAGTEIVQLYVQNPADGLFMAKKELRAFTRVFLRPGESRAVQLCFARKDLGYFHVGVQRFAVRPGTYTLQLGASSTDIRLQLPLVVPGEDLPDPYGSILQQTYRVPGQDISDEIFAALTGYTPTKKGLRPPLTIESPLQNLRYTFLGRMLYFCIMRIMSYRFNKVQKLPDSAERDAQMKNASFLVKMTPHTSFRSMAMSSGGLFTYNMARGLTLFANGHPIKGLRLAFTREKKPKEARSQGKKNRRGAK